LAGREVKKEDEEDERKHSTEMGRKKENEGDKKEVRGTKPPPETGTMMASRSGTCSNSSTATVP